MFEKKSFSCEVSSVKLAIKTQSTVSPTLHVAHGKFRVLQTIDTGLSFRGRIEEHLRGMVFKGPVTYFVNELEKATHMFKSPSITPPVLIISNNASASS